MPMERPGSWPDYARQVRALLQATEGNGACLHRQNSAQWNLPDSARQVRAIKRATEKELTHVRIVITDAKPNGAGRTVQGKYALFSGQRNEITDVCTVMTDA